MARHTGPVCRFCRREKTKLFLKGDRCFGAKCPIDGNKKKGPPGVALQKKKNMSEYGVQLRAKQKLRRHYGLLEKQFRLYFEHSAKAKGDTGLNLLITLERRLDNVVYRLGLAQSRSAARQLVRHGHILVNERRVDIPSYLVEVEDKVSIVNAMRENVSVVASREGRKSNGTKPWLDFNQDVWEGKILKLPAREDIDVAIEENLIVELYSR